MKANTGEKWDTVQTVNIYSLPNAILKLSFCLQVSQSFSSYYVIVSDS